MAVIATAMIFATVACDRGNEANDNQVDNLKLKALPEPVEAIEHFTGSICEKPALECGHEIVVLGNVEQMYNNLGSDPSPRRLPTALTDHIYVGHLNEAINGTYTVSLVYNSSIKKLFVVFKRPGIKTPVFVYPFSSKKK